jgi:hypothetical protein
MSFAITRRDIAAGVLIFFLALLLRMVVVFDRAARDPAFDPLPRGTDQNAYVHLAQGWEQGTWPRDPFYWQPGIVYFFIGLRALVGKSVDLMQLGMTVPGALGCGLMVGVGWLVTGRRWGGYLAGLILALYPVAIFYSTVLVVEGAASFYVCIFLFLTLWQKVSLSLWRSAAIGLILGLTTISRTNLALLWLAWTLYLWMIAPSKRRFLAHAALSLVGMILIIAPVTLWNIRHGSAQLISHQGLVKEIYRGNNRDADGTRSSPPAMDTVDDGYPQALWDDIARDPRHFIELELRKAGLYWSALEPGNNVSYVTGGQYASPLLNALRIDFRELAMVGWLGLVALFFVRRKEAWFFLAVNALIFVGVIPVWIEGRLRQPAVPPMAATAAVAMLVVGEAIRSRLMPAPPEAKAVRLLQETGSQTPPPDPLPVHGEGEKNRSMARPDVEATSGRGNSPFSGLGFSAAGRLQPLGANSGVLLRHLLLPALLILLAAGFLEWAHSHLPEKHPIAGLPADVHPLNINFDDRLQLLGWRPLDEWPAAEVGWTQPRRSYVVELFWTLTEPSAADYNVYLAYLDSGQRYAGRDRPIGGMSFHPKPTSQWQPGEIYSEITGFRLPQDTPTERSGEIRLGVYTLSADGNRTVSNVLATSLNGQPQSIALERLALFDLSKQPAAPDVADTGHVFGDQIALLGTTLPASAAPGETVNLSLDWQAVGEIQTDYTLFVHVEDAGGQTVAQYDGQPRQNTLLTSTWPPNYPIQDAVPLTLPTTAGVYRVYLGWYDAATMQRLAVDAPDNRLLIGQIQITGNSKDAQ